MKHFILPFLLPLVAACAGVSPTNLTPAASGASVVLKSPVNYDEYYSMAGNRFIYTINAGRYTARYQDAQGVYFEGADKCFTIRIEVDRLAREGKPQPAPRSYRCGIHIPNQASDEPKLYFYRDPEVSAEIIGNTTVQVVDGKGAPSAVPGASVGAGVGVGLVRALDAAELKNLHFYQDQPKPGQIRRAIE